MKTLRRIVNVMVFDTVESGMQVERTPEGFLRCAVNATRSGIFLYKDEFGAPIRALRSEEQVFDPASMATLAGKPITRTHPLALLDAATAKGSMVGSTGELVSRSDNFLRATANIFDASTIADIENGKKDVSCGYIADIIDSSGVDPVYGEYDVMQENIRYNHLAVGIEQGRGGPEVRMLMDASDLTSQKERTMDKVIKLGDAEYPCTEALHTAISTHLEGLKANHTKAMDEFAGKVQALADYQAQGEGELEALAEGEAEETDAVTEGASETAAAEGAPETAVTKMDSVKSVKGLKVKARIAKLLGMVEGLKKEAKTRMDAVAPVMDATMIAEAAKAQAVLVATVCALDSTAKPIELFSKTAADLRKLAILARDPKAILDGKSEDFILGRFEAVASSVKPSNIGEVLGSMLFDSGSEENEAEVIPTPVRKAWTPEPLTASTRAAAN